MQSNNKILLLENDVKTKEFISDLLESWGFSVVTAIDSIDAIKYIKENSFFLFIVSFELQDIEPFDLLNTILLNNQEIKVLFISERPSVDNAVNAMRNGALDFFIKPIVPEQLSLTLERVFGERDSKEPELKTQKGSKEIITKNKSMLKMLDIVKKVSNSNASVLIQGESGTGKELLANFIHQNSQRKDNNFVAVNCAVLPENLLESELFGHEKGSFTGATSKKIGKFEFADGGTIFLDEITEMDYKLQAKILRVIQERELERIGGLKTIPVDVRIVATTNRNIEESVANKEFREDLFYRLNVVPIKIIPLRHRRDDIKPLCEYFINKYNKIDNKSVSKLTQEAIDLLASHPFKGNVRELENIIRRAILFSDGDTIESDTLLLYNEDNTVAESQSILSVPNFDDVGSLYEIEKKAILNTLDKTVGNRTKASKLLGISVRTLRNKLKEYNETNSS